MHDNDSIDSDDGGDVSPLQAFGAKLVLTPATKGMGGSVAKAEAIVAEIGENAFMLQQFNNPDNPKVRTYCTSLDPSPLFPNQPSRFLFASIFFSFPLRTVILYFSSRILL